MKEFKSILVFFMVLLWPIFGHAVIQDQQAMKTRMVNDLEIIRNTFEIKYAPAEWKKIYADLNFDELIRQAKIKIIASDDMQIEGFQRVLKKLFKSMRDYHVGVRFYSTASSFLPFRVQKAQGKYFVSWVDASSTLPINQGDEIISFDNKPIEIAIQELKDRELGNVDSKTDQSLAEIFLTTRVGSLAHEIPTGNLKIVTRPRYYQGSELEEDLRTYKIQWDHIPEKVSHGPYQLAFEIPFLETVTSSNELNEYFNKPMIPSFYPPLLAAAQNQFQVKENNPGELARHLGRKKSVLPNLGELIWQSDDANPFHAYLFKTVDGKTAGYIRIPTYSGNETLAKAFSELINKFEQESEILVIDQFDNPGGIVFYMYALASMLSNTPLDIMTHRMTITQEDAFLSIEALKILENPDIKEVAKGLGFDDTVDGYPITEQLMRSLTDHFKQILNEWNTGFVFTSPTHLFGIQTLDPHPWGSYSKPILFLINELDFSCADFLPAVLQDNQRATLMGCKTAGAGGFVLNHSFPNRFGIGEYTFTGSIAERFDGNPIENLGVTPDIMYELTQRDLTDGFVDYISAIQSVISQLTPINPIPLTEEVKEEVFLGEEPSEFGGESDTNPILIDSPPISETNEPIIQ